MKLKFAYFDNLCCEKYTLSELQKMAQEDIEQLHIASENLFYFAYILDRENDDYPVFHKTLEKICDEFGFLKNLNDMQEIHIKEYFDFKIIQMKETKEWDILDKFAELRNFYEFLEEKCALQVKQLLPTFKSQTSMVDINGILQIFNRFYPDAKLNEETLILLYDLYFDLELDPHFSLEQKRNKLINLLQDFPLT